MTAKLPAGPWQYVSFISLTIDVDLVPKCVDDADVYAQERLARRLRQDFPGAKVEAFYSSHGRELTVVPDTEEAYDEVMDAARSYAGWVDHENWEQAA